MWQDYLITVAQIIFAISLFPSLLSKDKKPALQTSLWTALALFAMVIALYSLDAILGAILTTVNAILWLVLLYQRYSLDKNLKVHN